MKRLGMNESVSVSSDGWVKSLTVIPKIGSWWWQRRRLAADDAANLTLFQPFVRKPSLHSFSLFLWVELGSDLQCGEIRIKIRIKIRI